MFKLQGNYYQNLNEQINLNICLKQILVEYNNKYRNMLKKTHCLKEKYEHNNFKNTLAITINWEDNIRIKEQNKSNKKSWTFF